MGAMLPPHGLVVRVHEDWKSQEGGHSKGKVALGETCLLAMSLPAAGKAAEGPSTVCHVTVSAYVERASTLAL